MFGMLFTTIAVAVALWFRTPFRTRINAHPEFITLTLIGAMKLFKYVAPVVPIVVWFQSQFWGAMVAAFEEGVFLIILLSVRSMSWKHICELSDSANAMHQNYGHYYHMPIKSSYFSSCASGFQLASVELGVVCIFQWTWWSLGFAILALVNMGFMGLIARGFNPTHYLLDTERLAHEDVIAYLTSTLHQRYEA